MGLLPTRRRVVRATRHSAGSPTVRLFDCSAVRLPVRLLGSVCARSARRVLARSHVWPYVRSLVLAVVFSLWRRVLCAPCRLRTPLPLCVAGVAFARLGSCLRSASSVHACVCSFSSPASLSRLWHGVRSSGGAHALRSVRRAASWAASAFVRGSSRCFARRPGGAFAWAAGCASVSSVRRLVGPSRGPWFVGPLGCAFVRSLLRRLGAPVP